MGREVKRVAIDFDWPMKAHWYGYQPWFRPPKCEACDGLGYNPTAKSVYESYRFGSDGYKAVKSQFPGKSMNCKWCEGHGQIKPTDSEILKAIEPWKDKYGDYSFPPTEPPKGDGWQIWETVSEGSPVTPVFATAEELARWCETHQFDGKPMTMMAGEHWNYVAGGTVALNFEKWMKFITGTGWALSMIMTDEKIMSGVEAASE